MLKKLLIILTRPVNHIPFINENNQLDYVNKEELGGGSGLQLFDTISKDHILTYEESKGLALQGTYVYKEAVAGSRYGYPDFYSKVVEEYEQAEEKIVYTTRNFIETVGTSNLRIKENLAIEEANSIFSDFATDLYILSDYVVTQFEANKPYVVNFTTGSDVSTEQTIMCFELSNNGFLLRLQGGKLHYWSSTNGTSWNLSEKTGTSTLLANTTYTVTINWDGANYTVNLIAPDGTQTTEITIANTAPLVINSYKIKFGLSYDNKLPFLGLINFIRNNEIVTYLTDTWYPYNTSTVKHHQNGHKFYDIANKSAIDEIYNSTGLAWYYGLDTENERVFLPRNYWFEQVTGDILETGKPVKAGLPNILATFNAYGGASGAITQSGKAWSNSGEASDAKKMTFDASRFNSIYDNSDTVQPNAIKKLLYICVGNTETRSTITDVVDVTTTENDTIPLFTGMYFDFTPNNVSWLKGGQQTNNAGIYKFTYNELVNVLNGETKYGDLKVIDTTNMVSGIDYSQYWKVNQDEMYFITPTAISNKALSGAVAGNEMTLGLTNGTELLGLGNSSTASSTYRLYTSAGMYGTSVGSGGTSQSTSQTSLGITTDPTKSGIIAEQSNAQLYFKVANAVENLESLDAGEVLESLADKISRQDCCAYIVESYVNGTEGYNVYSNGYCEQWGQFFYVSNGTITLLKEYKAPNYCILLTDTDVSDTGGVATSTAVSNRTVNSITLSTTSEADNIFWKTCGYIA